MSDVISINTEELAKVKPSQTASKVATYKLLPENDPTLKQKLEHFDFNNPPIDPNTLASSLVETCILNRGLGLSANQCGLKHKVFVAGYGDEYVAYFNPEIIEQSTDLELGVEGCLSFPHLFFNVYRPKTVTLKYQDFTGEFHEKTFTGLSARVILHEYDHMNGVTFDDRTKPMAYKSGIDKRNKLFYKMERAQKQLSKMAKGKK